jgi:hypothetical protein
MMPVPITLAKKAAGGAVLLDCSTGFVEELS